MTSTERYFIKTLIAIDHGTAILAILPYEFETYEDAINAWETKKFPESLAAQFDWNAPVQIVGKHAWIVTAFQAHNYDGERI